MLKVKKIFFALLAVGSIVTLTTSCSNRASREVSKTTGWAYNDPENGDFQVTPAKAQITGPGLVFIEGGTFTMGATEESPFYEWDNQPRTVTVRSFYMDETEVRNIDYLEYIHWLQRVYGEDYPGVVRKALPDTNVWRRQFTYNEPLVETYFRYPAYHNYPVVGVSWLQANAYAAWRTDRVNEMLLIKAGYLSYNPHQKDSDSFNTEAYLAGQYQSKVIRKKKFWEFWKKADTIAQRIGLGKGILLPRYRLPTEAEWEYAALGLIGNTVNNRVVDRRIYPWNGQSLRNNNKKYLGRFRANFKVGRGDYMGVAGSLNDGASIPAPVMSYWPNDYGLYDMAGNVSEWVMDVYRPYYGEESDFDPFRGNNVFENIKRNAEGGIAKKDSLGRIPYVPISNAQAANYRNYNKANNNQYGITTLINDSSRVIKGGSWADGPYYLSPGARRYMNEAKSSATVGFRCAMTRVGSPISAKLKRK